MIEIFQPVCSSYSWTQGRNGTFSKSLLLLYCGETVLFCETEASWPSTQNPAIAPILEQIIADMVSYIIFIKYILYYPPSVTIVRTLK